MKRSYVTKAKTILSSAAIIFTVVYFTILAFSNLISETEQAITLKNSFVILAFSLILSALDLIFSVKNMNFVIKIALHFISVFISTAVISLLAGYNFGHRAYLMVFIFIFIYALICPFYILIGRKYKKHLEMR